MIINDNQCPIFMNYVMSDNVQHVFRILLCFEIFSDFSAISFEVSVSPCFSTVLFTI